MLVNPKILIRKKHEQYADGMWETRGGMGFSSDFDLWGRNDFDRSYFEVGDLSSCGVCDTPQQFDSDFREVLEADPRPLVVMFSHVRKNPEEQGGWRWHKWGPYVGRGDPQHEYLADEPGFDDGIFVYSIHIVDNLEVERP